MELQSPAIVVVAFSRPHALKRALAALNEACYRSNVKLIISIDGGASTEVVFIAKEFTFDHGEKYVFEHKENMGLRAHILKCGDLSETEGSVIIIEDDIVVDKFFHIYAQSALAFYSNDQAIAGISLYAPEYNEYAGLPFTPLKSEYDTYFMKVPCSWGQAWSADQWARFRTWLRDIDDSELLLSKELPSYVKAWGNSSWKKYFALYLVQCNKKIVYPYVSHSTNVSDEGGFHNKSGSNIVQVSLPLQNRGYRDYKFDPNNDSSIVYDSFMENCSDFVFDKVKSVSGVKGSLCFDFYGLKGAELLSEFDYCVTSKKTRASILAYKADYRPVENNVLLTSGDVVGNHSFVLTEVSALRSRSSKYPGDTLLYWSGFNFLSRRFFLANIVGVLRKFWSKL
ncbi:glycosyltransferase family A protein [Marinobacter sp. EN3]|uniref:glycosyltransferase family A protein n=1 Tax=Marinobacter sp. EN3 TaxID=1397533 RepID=UPI0004B304BA|nr:glycosyltransferase family A protein [Marinobacter sp. EN3]